ncbi:MAG: hypothetical protein H6865_08450 [Rhodospirillales bacterium]|nr:hypothetical protein [Alphaproteobacteria bacterium]MCB9987645.1 hypothetical protein [Rhodospirillales bacterium]USO08056.1 MAG: hypothetical protein H6866_02225 [Rhodospirillales bacterium]
MHRSFTGLAAPDPDWRLCDIIIAWDELEKSIDGYPPVDSNLVGHRADFTFSYRAEVIDAFSGLRKEALSLGNTDMVSRIDQFLLYIDCAEHPEKHPFYEYFPAMTGLRLNSFAEARLAQAKEKLTAHLETIRIPFEGVEDALYGVEPGMDAEESGTHIRTRIGKELEDFKAVTGLDVALDYDVKVIEDAAPWTGWMSGDADGKFLLRFNKTHIPALSPSYLMYVGRHELLGHAVMETLMRQRVLSGELPRSCGIITMADNCIVQAEALAETADRLVLSHEKPVETAWRLLTDYKRLVANNAFVVLARQGMDEAREYYTEHVPRCRETGYMRLFNGLLSANPQPRMYIPVYACVRAAMGEAFDVYGREAFGAMYGQLYRNFGGFKIGVNDALGLDMALRALGRTQDTKPEAKLRVGFL